MWARIADALTVVLLLAGLYVAVFGGVRIGTVFSMSTPWRALLGLTVICGLRHYLVRTSPLHERVWRWLCSVAQALKARAIRWWRSRPGHRAVQRGRRWLIPYERATRMPVARTLHYFALTALAVAQPLFDVVSREPTFFVARNTTSGQLVAFVVVIGVALPLVLVTMEAVFTRLHAAAGSAVHVVLVTGLCSALLLPLLKRAGGLDTIPVIAASVVLGGIAAFGLQRFSVARMFVTALSPAAVVVPAVFLTNPDIRGAVVRLDLAPVPAQVEQAPPIVFVVFDEFPTSSLLNREREIDRQRYPNFARLADDATWFRNASTVSSQTPWAVPAIVTGRYPLEPHAVPTLRYYPNNLFTMLSERYEMTVFGRFLQLCPANACQYDLEVRDTLGALTADLGVVYLHVIAPDALAARLPPIVGDWREFATRRMFREVDGQRRRNDRLLEYQRFLETITPEPSGRLYFLHTLTPHMPFEYVPSGKRYRAPDYQGHREGGERLFLKSDPWLPVVLQQRHLLQVGFVDRFIGNLVDRLQAQGVYEESLIIVTADHGASFRHGMSRRTSVASDPADIVMVPLFVKLPRQQAGAVSDANVETVDIVPTIADALSTTVPYEIDGRSLLGSPEPERTTKTFVRRNLERVRVESYPQQPEDHSLAQTLMHFEAGLYGLGPHASLVGRPVSTLDTPPASEALVRLENARAFANVNAGAELLPLWVRGAIRGDVTERLSLGIGVNGLLVATTVSYVERGEWMFASMIPEEALASGANKVQVFVLGGVSEDAAPGSVRMAESGG